LGTAIIAVVLQSKTESVHSITQAASGFSQTYWWVMAVTLVALAPTLLLARIERQARRAGQTAPAIPAEALAEAA
jgi:hypothetical protein